MTVLIWALDGLDAEYVQKYDLLDGLGPSELHNDLEGANALYTYRIWPAIWRGINGGADYEDENARYVRPDGVPIWEKYAATVMLAIMDDGPYSQYQNQFPDDFRESVGPMERVEDILERYHEGIVRAVEQGSQLIVVGSKLPDLVGHLERNRGRAHRKIAELNAVVEQTIKSERVDNFLVVSDHGFDYKKFGERPSGISAHRRRAVLASDFADYDYMTDFIEGWHDDLHEAIKKNQLESLGYA